MSMQAVSWAWQQKAGSPEAKLVLIFLADAAGEEGECALSESFKKWVADRAEMTVETLRDQMTWLAGRGLIVDVEPGLLVVLPCNELARGWRADPEAARERFYAEIAATRAAQRGE